jgi:hypothetical protein
MPKNWQIYLYFVMKFDGDMGPKGLYTQHATSSVYYLSIMKAALSRCPSLGKAESSRNRGLVPTRVAPQPRHYQTDFIVCNFWRQHVF